jgi:drug/metabolite transporter (DMT)-like permease
VSHAKVGVASALMTTSPILLIPLSSLFLKEKIRRSVIIGTIITVVGSILLFVSKPG